MIKREAEKNLKYEYKYLTIEIQRMWNVKNKSDTNNNRGNWNNLKIARKISEKSAGKA